MNTKNFSQKLKNFRNENGKTQKEIAEMLEISATCYAGYEQGYREPDLSTLKKICILFETSADYLIGLEDETGSKIYNNYGIHNGNVKF